jgi:hypothetical protein
VRLARLPEPRQWPRTEALLTAFGEALGPALPAGVQVSPPSSGRVLSLKFSRGGGGSFGCSAVADMPQVTPKDMARDLKFLMKGVSTMLGQLHPGWPDASSPQLRFMAEGTGATIRTWWQDEQGNVALRLSDIDLREAGLA